MQIQSNALAALEAIDQGMAEAIMKEGCVTGDRINGLCDGVTGDWWALLVIHAATSSVDNGAVCIVGGSMTAGTQQCARLFGMTSLESNLSW